MPNLFSTGLHGLSDGKFSGVEGSVAACVGLDLHSSPGLIKVQQALAKNSGTTVTALCRAAVTVSDGRQIWFSYTDGKIWEKDTSDVWTLVYTVSPAAGAAGCLGAAEFDGYIYWATQSRLHRMPVANLGSAANWTANAVPNWATFAITDSEFHPMAKQNLALFIGDGNYVARVSGATGAHAFDNGSVSGAGLDLKAPLRVKTLIDFDIDLLIGTFVHANVNYCEVIRWDTESESWNTSDSIDENGVNAFIRDDNYVYAQCGRFGRIYFYDGEKLVPYKRIPGTWSPTATAEIHPGSVAMLLTIPIFGLSNITGNPVNQGVYSFGSYGKDYPKVLDLSFPISAGVLTGVDVGAILVSGADLYVAWKDNAGGGTYGVDKLNYSAKYASAYLETMVLTTGDARNSLHTLDEIWANYETLPASTAIGFKYKKAHEANFSSAMTTLKHDIKKRLSAKATINQVASLQIRVDFTVSGNNAPTVEDIGYKTNLIP